MLHCVQNGKEETPEPLSKSNIAKGSATESEKSIEKKAKEIHAKELASTKPYSVEQGASERRNTGVDGVKIQ